MKRPVWNPAWPPSVQRVYEHDMQEMWDRWRAPHIWNMYHAELDMYLALARRYNPQTILDVGCAQGTLALLLAEQGYRVWALDIRPEFLNYARSRYEHGEVEFICGDVLSTPLEPQFDLVFANQVIEHLLEPQDLLRKLYQLLVPGGHLVITTPNYHYFRNRLPSHRAMGDFAGYVRHHASAEGEDHFYALSAGEMLDYACEAGFADPRVAYYASPWVTGHFKFRYLHGWVPAAILRGVDALTIRMPGVRQAVCYQLCLTATRRRVCAAAGCSGYGTSKQGGK